MNNEGFAVTVKVHALLTKLTENRLEHRDTYTVACQVYKAKVIEKLTMLLAMAQAESEEGIVGAAFRMDLLQPEDHTDDYDRVIGMLRMANQEDITLSESQYKRYVLDEWEWSNRWFENTVSYTEAA